MPQFKNLKIKTMEIIRALRPSPFFVTLVFILAVYAIQVVSQKMNAGPFFIDLDALNAGQTENAVVFDMSQMTVLAGVLLVAFELIVVILDFGYRSYVLQASRRFDCGVGDLLDGFSYAFRVILLWLIKSFFLSALLLVFIVPGIIAFYGYRQAEFLLVDHPDWSPIRCLRESRLLMRGHKWELFLLDLSFLFLHILSVFIFTKVFIAPYIQITLASYYNVLISGDSSDLPHKDESVSEKKPWEY